MNMYLPNFEMFTNKSGKEYALKSRTREARIKTFKRRVYLNVSSPLMVKRNREF